MDDECRAAVDRLQVRVAVELRRQRHLVDDLLVPLAGVQPPHDLVLEPVQRARRHDEHLARVVAGIRRHAR